MVATWGWTAVGRLAMGDVSVWTPWGKPGLDFVWNCLACQAQLNPGLHTQVVAVRSLVNSQNHFLWKRRQRDQDHVGFSGQVSGSGWGFRAQKNQALHGKLAESSMVKVWTGESASSYWGDLHSRRQCPGDGAVRDGKPEELEENKLSAPKWSATWAHGNVILMKGTDPSLQIK